MISYSELKTGSKILLEDGDPYEIIDSSPMVKAQRESVLQAKLRNLKTEKVISRNFHPSESFDEPDLESIEAKFLYGHRDKFVFCEKKNPGKRFEFTEEQIGNQKSFLTANMEVTALLFEEKPVSISLPIKVNLKVTEAPPSIKGERAQSGTKIAKVETGAQVNVPAFINTGDIIEVNTQTGEYSRRVE